MSFAPNNGLHLFSVQAESAQPQERTFQIQRYANRICSHKKSENSHVGVTEDQDRGVASRGRSWKSLAKLVKQARRARILVQCHGMYLTQQRLKTRHGLDVALAFDADQFVCHVPQSEGRRQRHVTTP